jgi:hypothetical protein
MQSSFAGIPIGAKTGAPRSSRLGANHVVALGIPLVIAIPVCQQEDGSDIAALPCVWTDTDTGDAYLTYGVV